jgi:beta-glucosidase
LNAYPGKDRTVRYDEGLLVGYRWFDTKKIEPLFPFGYGLSYTKFEYSNLKLVKSDGTNGTTARVEFELKNTGTRPGAEVAQVYVHQNQPRLLRPFKELKAFRKVFLKAGETRQLSIPLEPGAFAFYDPARRGWVVEKDTYTIFVGSSSQDIRLQGELEQAAASFEREGT